MNMESCQSSIGVRFAEAISIPEPISAENEVAHGADSPQKWMPCQRLKYRNKIWKFESKVKQ